MSDAPSKAHQSQPSAPDEIASTRWTRVRQLQERSDDESWQWFYRTYSGLIYKVARGSALSDEQARQVVQDTAIHVSKSLKKFKADPAAGSFKGWLRTVAQGRIVDLIRAQQAEARLPRHHALPSIEEERRTATEERVPDPAGGGFQARWDEEWQSLARAELKKRVDEKQYQIFDHHVFQEQAAAKVARAFGVKRPYVYVVKFRLMPVYRRVLEDLDRVRQGAGVKK